MISLICCFYIAVWIFDELLFSSQKYSGSAQHCMPERICRERERVFCGKVRSRYGLIRIFSNFESRHASSHAWAHLLRIRLPSAIRLRADAGSITLATNLMSSSFNVFRFNRAEEWIERLLSIHSISVWHLIIATMVSLKSIHFVASLNVWEKKKNRMCHSYADSYFLAHTS